MDGAVNSIRFIGVNKGMLTPALECAVTDKKNAFQQGMLLWASCHLRDYPWRRQGQGPYAVLVGELLLKRTTATAATRVYRTLLEKYPTPADLAAATEEELARDLASVGLYTQRARAIARLARYLLEREAGSVPCSLDRLLKLPGLGDYGARAVLTFGCDAPVAVVDANVSRVLERVFLLSFSGRPNPRTLQATADVLLPRTSTENSTLLS